MELKSNCKCKKCGREFCHQGFDDSLACPNCGSHEIEDLNLENLLGKIQERNNENIVLGGNSNEGM